MCCEETRNRRLLEDELVPLLEDLTSFMQLAKTRNFGRTAKLLGITASSLTRRIQALERELGCTLLRRSTRSVTLTEQGAQVLARAEILVQEAANLKADLAHSSKQLSGPIRVGAPVDLAITVLGPPLAAFCREHPSIALNFIAAQGQPDLQKDELDVAFLVVHQRPMPDSAFTLSRMGAFPRLLFASADYISQHGIPKSPKDLRAHPCVRHFQDGPETYWDLRSGSKRARVPVRVRTSQQALRMRLRRREQGLESPCCRLILRNLCRTAA